MNTYPALHLKAIVSGLLVLATHPGIYPIAAALYLGWLVFVWEADDDSAAPNIESIPASPGYP